MEIGEMIKTARIKKGLTMKDVAKYVGVSEAAVSKWESGHISTIKNDKLILLSQILDIPVLSLVMTEEDIAVRKINLGKTYNAKVREIAEICSKCTDEQLDKIITMIKLIVE